MDHSLHNLDHDHHAHHHDMGTTSDPGGITHDHGQMASEDSSMNMCDMSGHMGHSMMSMTFHFGYCETVLFEAWKISSVGGLIGSMIGIFFMAALYEGLKYYREYLYWKTYNGLQYRSVAMPGEKGVPADDSRVVHMVGEVIHKQPPTKFSPMHCLQTFLHVVQFVISYFLMLIFMTYNVWLCVAVVAGAAVGYFLFAWKKSVVVDVTEHCH